MDSLKSTVQTDIQNIKVLVYSKSYCPYASATKKLLKDGNVQATVIELDQVPNGDQLQAALQQISGQRTVPNIYINGKHIGGNSDIQALHSKGELKTMLQAAGVSCSY